jgi:maltooligosyltrehalose trehalohydrolase
LIHLRRRSASLSDGDLGHVEVKYDEQGRWLDIDRGGMRVLANLGRSSVDFGVAEGFRVTMISRPDVGVSGGKISLPPDTLAVLSNERGLLQ